jgi:hypothetical protein
MITKKNSNLIFILVFFMWFGKLSANGLGIAEGGEIFLQMFNLAPQLAKPLFFANLHFSKQKKWFCGIEILMLNFNTSAPLLAIPC